MAIQMDLFFEKLSTAVFLLVILLFVCGLGLSIWGLVLAFKASIILGIISIIVQPCPLVFGVCALFGTNVPMAIQAWINFPI